MNAIIDFFRPPDDAPVSMRRWCYGVALSLTIMWIGFGLAFKVFATESGLQNSVKQEVAIQIKPVIEAQKQQTAQQQKTDQKVDRMGILLIENLATGKAQQIRAMISKRCKAQTFGERDEAIREIDRLQGEYVDLKGARYEAPSCAEL